MSIHKVIADLDTATQPYTGEIEVGKQEKTRSGLEVRYDADFVSTEIVPVNKKNYHIFGCAIHTIIFDEYDKFCLDLGLPLPSDAGWGRGRRPAVNINLIQFIHFINWWNLKRGRPSVTYILAKKPNNEMWIWEHPDVKSVSELIQEFYGGTVPTGKEWDKLVEKSWYQIPTEKDWVEAADDGYKYSGSDNLDEVAWYAENSNNMTHPVCEKKPNSYGIYDMHGNVWEMCLPQRPPKMTKEIWKEHFPKLEYMDLSDKMFDTWF